MQICLGNDCELELVGSLLQIRGGTAYTIPIEDEKGNVLLMNGEIYDGLDVPSGESDSLRLARALPEFGDGEGLHQRL